MLMTVTEENLECPECDWVGTESEAKQVEIEDDTEFRCPACGATCAHFPINEIGETVETLIFNGWNTRQTRPPEFPEC